jgi:RNA polymerase sigma-70 factor (ECF subfamily)
MLGQGKTARVPLESPRPSGGQLVALPRAGSDDAALRTGLIEGQPAAVAELFDRYASLVRRILVRTLGGAHDIDDLIQETILVLLRRIGSLEKPEALRSFVVSVAIRTAKNELRKRSVRCWVGLDSAPEPLTSPAHDPVVADRLRRVYRALERLDAPSRVLFVLRHVEQFELTELAAASQCSLATVKRRLSRAEKRFEAMMRGDPELRLFLERED